MDTVNTMNVEPIEGYAFILDEEKKGKKKNRIVPILKLTSAHLFVSRGGFGSGKWNPYKIHTFFSPIRFIHC